MLIYVPVRTVTTGVALVLQVVDGEINLTASVDSSSPATRIGGSLKDSETEKMNGFVSCVRS